MITALALLGVIHGGGQSAAAPAYGYSAALLFPVLAWQAKHGIAENGVFGAGSWAALQAGKR